MQTLLKNFLARLTVMLLLSIQSSGQSCVPTNLNNRIITLPCGTTCASLDLQIPHLKTNSTYAFNTIAYEPFPYIVSGGSEDLNLYGDDFYSSVINLPFTFCFYDSSYNKVVVGSNGLITFDVTNASCDNAYEINNTIPSAATDLQCFFDSEYYPRASIMGAFSDLFPVLSGSPPGMKIQWRSEGTAPCRKFVVSFFRVGTFGNNNCSFLTPNTFQIVLYESTGLIDIFVENRTCLSTSTGGRAIMGVQNWERDQGVAAVDKNATPWASAREGFRFTPNGAQSKFISSQLLNMSGQVLSTADTTTTTPGLLDINFSNICPTGASTQYVVKTTFSACPTGVTMTSLDTITVNKSSSVIFTTNTTPACPPGLATITVNVTAGTGPYQYSINAGPVQASNIFTGLNSGTYNVLVHDASGCVASAAVIVPVSSLLTATASGSNTACAGVNNGSVTTISTGGNPPYQYSINGGTTFQTGATFPNLAPGIYTITVQDNAGCRTSVTATISAGTNIVSSVATVNPPCANTTTGTITINPATGNAPFLFSLNGGAVQASNVFTNLLPGTYAIAIRDAVGCTGTNSATLTTNSPLSTQVIIKMPLCNGNSNGSITLTPSGGIPPYQYSKDGGTTYQASNVLGGFSIGTYTIRIKDNVGCTKDTTVSISQPAVLNATANSVAASCEGNDGVINVTATGGSTPYQYSINGSDFSGSNNLTAPAPGLYTVTVKDANGCLATTTNTVLLIDNMTLDAGADTTVCAEQSVVLQPITNAQTNIFNWTPNSTINNNQIKNPSVSPLSTITYYLRATWGLCTHSDSVKVTVKNKPVAYAGPDVTICDNDSTMLMGSVSNVSGTVNYLWSPGVSVASDKDSITLAFPILTQTYTLTVTDNYGCNYSVKDEVKLTVRPPVPAFAGNDSIAILGAPYQLNATGGSQFSWTPSSILNSPSISNPIATLAADTRFIVTVTDIVGCVGTDTVFVKAYNGPTYYTPNAFSPNGDGLNDIFRAIPVGIVSTEYFRIFNRYGELIFETNQWLKGWDGTYMNKKQPFGVYVWIVKGRDGVGKVVEKKGTVLLIQ